MSTKADPNVLYNEFNRKRDVVIRTELREKIGKCKNKNDLMRLKEQVVLLGDGIYEKIADLPAYDQKYYSENIVALLEKTEAQRVVVSKNRFTFKRKLVSKDIGSLSAKTENDKESKSKGRSDVGNESLAKPLYDRVEHKNIRLSYPSGHALIKNIKESIITTISPPPGSIHLETCCDSIVWLVSSGPIFIHNLSRVKLIVDCHQLRLHNAKECEIYLKVGSKRAIIENCEKLKIYAISSGTDGQEDEIEIDDFNWPSRLEVDPNYSMGRIDAAEFGKQNQGLTDIPDNEDIKGAQYIADVQRWEF
ncbi:uncharacterized protein ASCRUDRAFT_71936 [Ascoidea rubescens DSM 1968]|uniref:C-CAP/cofactor C-like domain-containing protein n=1 Tax=Ascoidea rubescens DSM 1968 TaxID=1344418 RepID=A0A1D2VC78_9ASCO|nr:hypothetical protein ASCRUDRAFT_71936 [Ascoidea rubescens DSM 1968]ODV59219.1 hypothetical protein ASCRUDRAFT_71936 [Ascoidea rubescens DSM 1968]